MANGHSEVSLVAEVLGGEEALGRRVRTLSQLEQCAREGFPPATAKALVEHSVVESRELYGWIVPRRTLAHRVRKAERLNREESDRISRVARIYALAAESFGDLEKGRRWLRKPLRQFAGRTPMAMLETELGASQVETLLGRISHGIAA